MKKSIFMMSLAAVLLMTSCASKKDLAACKEENKALQTNYQNTKEQLAASTTRVASLEEQISELRKTNATLQASLDKSLSNTSQNNVSIENETDWFQMATFHADWTKRFYDVIVSYIKTV